MRIFKWLCFFIFFMSGVMGKRDCMDKMRVLMKSFGYSRFNSVLMIFGVCFGLIFCM